MAGTLGDICWHVTEGWALLVNLEVEILIFLLQISLQQGPAAPPPAPFRRRLKFQFTLCNDQGSPPCQPMGSTALMDSVMVLQLSVVSSNDRGKRGQGQLEKIMIIMKKHVLTRVCRLNMD